jgi:hypothetical protein
MRFLLSSIVSSTLVVAACTGSPVSPGGTNTANQALEGANGISVNGISVNGISVNGTSLNGISVNGISVNGISVNGISVNGISVNGGSLNGVSPNGTSINGVDFDGATMTAVLSNGGTLAMHVDSSEYLTGSNSDVLGYAVSMQGDDGWVPACGTESDGSPVLALVVPGVWDLSNGSWSDAGPMFSLSCRHASVAKCVEFGYKSWLGYSDHHHACVRMLRADYCGDGTPHTVTGTLINLYDDAGIQADAESWPVDAEWGPDGALCVNHNRGGSQPSCYAAKYSASCGSFDDGALLIDEYNGGQ